MTKRRDISVDERAQQVRDEAAQFRARRLGRGNYRIQNCDGENVSVREAQNQRAAQPERVEKLNRLLCC